MGFSNRAVLLTASVLDGPGLLVRVLFQGSADHTSWVAASSPVCGLLVFFFPGWGIALFCPKLLPSPVRAGPVFSLLLSAPVSPDETSSLHWRDSNEKHGIQASPQRVHLPLTWLTALLWGVYKNCTCYNS